MSSASVQTHFTFDEFLAWPEHDFFELVDGTLVEVEMSNLAARVASRVNARLVAYCEAHDFGEVFSSDAYYRCFPGHPNMARKPDVSFIHRNRLPQNWAAESHFERRIIRALFP